MNNNDGCFQILDSSLKMNFIEVEFPLQICPQLLFLTNLLNTDFIKSISVKSRENCEYVVVWDKTANNNNEMNKNFVPLNLVTFTTNHVRFLLENDDISPFLQAFSIELQGLYSRTDGSIPNEYFSALLNDSKFSDIEFLVENRSIKAHKCIISMKCPYFNSIFKKSSQEPIIIENRSYNSFNFFIKYLYTNNLNGTFFSPDLLGELFNLSIYYNVLDLKEVCLNEFYNLCSDPNNIMDLYHMAVNYNIDELIDICLNLLSHNFELILCIRKDNFY